MTWKFWQNKTADTTPTDPKVKKLPKPKELPTAVGRYLVVTMAQDPDWVWKLKSVARPKGESKTAFDIRVFDEAAAREKGISVRDYHSLDAHPELVIFQGWYDKGSNAVQVEKKTDAATFRLSA